MSRENSSGRGVFAHYGPRATNEKGGGALNAGGRKKQLVATLAYDDLPAGGLDDALSQIPAGAVITGGWASVTVAWVGGTSIGIGLVEPDGTAMDPDGLWGAIATAEIDALTESVAADGALVDTRLDTSGVLTTVVVGTYTAGELQVVVEYVLGVPTAAELVA